MPRTSLRLCALTVSVFWLAGCGPRIVRTRILENNNVRVELRHAVKSGKTIEHSYSQPATIADVRLAHILASLYFEDKDQKRLPAIRSIHVYDLADGIAKAFAQAGPDDEVAAAAFPVDKRFGIFSDEKVTALRMHVEGELLRIEFLALEDPLEKDGSKIGYREYEIPTEFPSLPAKFTLVPSEKQAKVGPRGINVTWRDDYYRKPVNLRYREGAPKRRTVLMEIPSDKATDKAPPPGAPVPSGLSDLQLRALDQAEAARQSGSITELEYQRRRGLILEGKLDEAGYGTPPQ
jgi:hypothetical protein